MLGVGRCGVARLQMKVGHMDGMHCFIDSTSVLVKIKSFSLYNCRIVYVFEGVKRLKLLLQVMQNSKSIYENLCYDLGRLSDIYTLDI